MWRLALCFFSKKTSLFFQQENIIHEKLSQVKRLTAHQMDKLFESIEILNSSIDPQTLPNRTIKAVSKLIANHSISFDVFSAKGTLDPLANWHEPVGIFTEELFEIFSECISEHIFHRVLMERKTGVYRNTDAVSIGEFKKTRVFNELYRLVDITYQLHTTMPVNNDLAVSCSISRENLDFSDGEKQMLEIFSPHLCNALDNSNAFEKVVKEKSRVENVLNKLSRAAIIFDDQDKVLQKTRSCQFLISKYFSKHQIDSFGIPFTLRKWMKRQKFRLTGEEALNPVFPLFFENAEDQLRVNLLIENRKRRKTLLFEEQLEVSESQIITLGLTPRESQVLLLISKGKTNPEIAFLFDISPRTVQKHTAHIFEKLGVETRTAAALRVHELH